jgi:HEAT repeat protein
MAESPYPTRKQAGEQLARRWPAATRYTVDVAPSRRAEQMAELTEEWKKLSPTATPESSVAAGEMIFAAVDAEATERNSPPSPLAAHHQILAPAEPVAAALERMTAEDVEVRRAAAKQLADYAAKVPLDEPQVARLTELAMAETDPLVWRELVQAVKSETSDAAVRLAYVGTGHASAEVRRLSCGYLAAHSDPRHAGVLARLLNDPNRDVARSAIEAFASPGALPDPALLERLLAGDDANLQIAAARSLAVNGFPSGPAALERLAIDPDADIRRQAAATMGQLRDPAYLGVIVTMLDDDLSVRLASVASLAQIVGQDVNIPVGENPPPLAEQVQGWKRWWQSQRERQASQDGAANSPLQR